MWILLFNILVYCLSVSFLADFDRLWRKVLCFFILLATDVFVSILLPLEPYSILFLAEVVFLFQLAEKKDALAALYSTMLTIMFAMASIALFGGIAILYNTEWIGTVHYNLFIGLLHLLTTLWISGPIRRRTQVLVKSGVMTVFVVFSCICLIFTGACIPILIKPGLQTEYAPYFYRLYAIFCVFITLVFGCSYFLIAAAAKEIRRRAAKEIELETLLDQFHAVNKVIHYFRNVLLSLSRPIDDGDIEATKKCFYGNVFPYIQPEAKENCTNMKIQSVQDLLYGFIKDADSKSVPLEIDIPFPIYRIGMGEKDMCEILSILFENALFASMGIDAPQIKLRILQTDKAVVFDLSNKTGQPPKNRSPNHGYGGYGLKYAMELVNKYANVYLDTRPSPLFRQTLVVRNDRFD